MSAKTARDFGGPIIHRTLMCGNIRTLAGENTPKADPNSTTLVARFWSKVERKSDSECWLWTATTRKGGYGAIKVAGRKESAHRLAYVLSKGRIQAGRVVRHTCDNPPCCNPAHLRLGTPKQNTADSIRRGRHVNPVNPALQKYVDGGYSAFRATPRKRKAA